jgi:putative MFS transporter
MSHASAAQGAGASLIAARIDRLPLTRVQWGLAILVEITWGFIIVDTDGIGARLYPFVWRPAGLLTVNEYAVIQALQVGLGVLLGSYVMSWVADRYGRRPAILLSALLAGVFLWPFAFVFNFWGLVVASVLSTLGVGGIVATHAVYISEMTSPDVRSKVMLSSQGSTAVVGVFVSLLARQTFPHYWQTFIWISVAIQVFGLVPLIWWRLPESPRWLEAAGRHDEAERVLALLEREVARFHGGDLPAPDPVPRAVGRAEKGAWREIITNRMYLGRAILILICWLCCYPGIVYGGGVFAAVFMVDHGADAEAVFTLFLVGSVATFIAFMLNAQLGEQVERRDTLVVIGAVYAVTWAIIWAFPTMPVIWVGYTIARICTYLFLFNLYNYTAVAFPTRIRSVAFAWTDGLGHLGAWAGVTLLGPLYSFGPNHLGWVLFVALPGALLPGVLIRGFGMKQSRAVLEHVSK